MTWEKTTTAEQLKVKPALHKSGKKQIAVFMANDCAYAVDNRCPHEGYPLVEGTVSKDCVLTCNWHNWKFRLQDGECILGGDHVRSYPARVQDGYVWVNTDDPPRETIRNEILCGLRTAFDRRDYGRICREIARLHFNDFDPLLAVRQAVEWSYDCWEFGTTHAYAAAADWVMQANHCGAHGDVEKKIICLAEAVDHIADDALRQRPFPYAGGDESFKTELFIAAVENEDLARAEAMVQTGLRDGLHWHDMESAFVQSALDHYNDFGHSLIYVYKTSQLLQFAGDSLEPFLLPPLARHLCYTTREDLIPEFKSYAPALKALPPAPGKNLAIADEDLFGLNTEKACKWVAAHYGRSDPLALYETLLCALAKNMLHFDTRFDRAYDRPVSQNIGWLDFTHGVTFANAVRNMCTKYPHLWGHGLLQMACFLGRNHSYVDADLPELPWFVANREEFWRQVEEIILDHGFRVPIFSAHVIKTAKATEEELEHAAEPCQRFLLAALNRFLHSPLKQKHARRLARQAVALVKRDFAT